MLLRVKIKIYSGTGVSLKFTNHKTGSAYKYCIELLTQHSNITTAHTHSDYYKQHQGLTVEYFGTNEEFLNSVQIQLAVNKFS